MSDDILLPETFNPSAHKGTGSRSSIPVGWYPAQIIETDVRHANNGNGTYLLATFEITEGDYHGRKIFPEHHAPRTTTNRRSRSVRVSLKDIYEGGWPRRADEVERDILLYKPVMARGGIKRDKDGVYPIDKNCDFLGEAGRIISLRGASGPASQSSPTGRSTPSTPAAAAGSVRRRRTVALDRSNDGRRKEAATITSPGLCPGHAAATLSN